jgi:hypothetical protein
LPPEGGCRYTAVPADSGQAGPFTWMAGFTLAEEK